MDQSLAADLPLEGCAVEFSSVDGLCILQRRSLFCAVGFRARPVLWSVAVRCACCKSVMAAYSPLFLQCSGVVVRDCCGIVPEQDVLP